MTDQNTEAWEQWRNQGLGSSDAPIVMGVSPWTTRYQLWEIKRGVRKGGGSNWATDRGHRLEPRARATYEMQNGFVDMSPLLVEHASYPFLRSSLDGYNDDLRRVLEIKCPGKDAHAKAKAGEVPEYYIPQTQMQLLITGAERCDYFSYHVENEGKANEVIDTATVIVYPDIAYCRNLLAELCAFWDLVLTGTPPAFDKRDYKFIRAKAMSVKAREYAFLKDSIADVVARLAALENEMINDPLVKDLERWRSGPLHCARVGDTIRFDVITKGESDDGG